MYTISKNNYINNCYLLDFNNIMKKELTELKAALSSREKYTFYILYADVKFPVLRDFCNLFPNSDIYIIADRLPAKAISFINSNNIYLCTVPENLGSFSSSVQNIVVYNINTNSCFEKILKENKIHRKIFGKRYDICVSSFSKKPDLMDYDEILKVYAKFITSAYDKCFYEENKYLIDYSNTLITDFGRNKLLYSFSDIHSKCTDCKNTVCTDFSGESGCENNDRIKVSDLLHTKIIRAKSRRFKVNNFIEHHGNIFDILITEDFSPVGKLFADLEKYFSGHMLKTLPFIDESIYSWIDIDNIEFRFHISESQTPENKNIIEYMKFMSGFNIGLFYYSNMIGSEIETKFLESIKTSGIDFFDQFIKGIDEGRKTVPGLKLKLRKIPEEDRKTVYIKREDNGTTSLINKETEELISNNLRDIPYMTEFAESVSGDVLLVGAGLCVFPILLKKHNKNIKSLTILEENRDIIRIANKYYLGKLSFPFKINVIEGNIETFRPEQMYDYGYINMQSKDIPAGTEAKFKKYLKRFDIKPSAYIAYSSSVFFNKFCRNK